MRRSVRAAIALAGAGLLVVAVAGPGFTESGKPSGRASVVAQAKKPGPLGALVKKGVLSSAQAKLVREGLARQKAESRVEAIRAAVEAAVTSGSVTSEQGVLLVSALTSGKPGDAEVAGVEPSVVRSIMEAAKASLGERSAVAVVVASLVGSGVLSAEQGSMVVAALEAAKAPGSGSGAPAGSKDKLARGGRPATGSPESTDPAGSAGDAADAVEVERPRGERPRGERPRGERPSGDAGAARGDRPRGERPASSPAEPAGGEQDGAEGGSGDGSGS